MSVEVNLVGTRCGAAAGGLSCTYCYQAPTRRADRNSTGGAIDHEAIQRAVIESGCTPREGFSVFGGEPLLARIEDLERVWAFGLERYGKNGVQTSGRPITEEHLALFKKYRVHVGFSIDGPGEHNDARVAGTPTDTRRATEHSIAMLKRCLADGIGASLIVTLSTHNASPSRLPGLLAWFRDLAACGLKDARLHPLEVDSPYTKLIVLPDEWLRDALLACDALDVGIGFDIFKDIRKLVSGKDREGVTCTFAACDPWRTTAVHGIGADGSRYMCTRVQKDGVKYRPVGPGPLVRNLVLAETPQEQGGCKGCRFMILCKGQCPGTAIDGDWRKRTRDCKLWFDLFEHVERQTPNPVSLRADLPEIEARMVAAWEMGLVPSVQDVMEGAVTRAYFTADHGDRPHGDEHGDHTDMGGAK